MPFLAEYMVLQGKGDEVAAFGATEFLHHLCLMGVNGLDTQMKFLANFCDGIAMDEILEYFVFARTQLLERSGLGSVNSYV